MEVYQRPILKFSIINDSALLAGFKFLNQQKQEELFGLIKEELNVKAVVFAKDLGQEVELDTVITKDLRSEGLLRELIRTINSLRKDQGLTIGDKIKVLWQSDNPEIIKVLTDKKLANELKNSVLADEFVATDNTGEVIKINDEEIKIKIEKI